MSKIFKTADELYQYINSLPLPACWAWVDSNPYGDGTRQKLFVTINQNGKYVDTFSHSQSNIAEIDYAYGASWHKGYKGTFTLVEPEPVKPEVYQVGDWVEITEEARKCGGFKSWLSKATNMVGGKFQIKESLDYNTGVQYCIYNTDQSGFYIFPHYCVKRVEKPVETVTLEVPKELLEQIKKLING